MIKEDFLNIYFSEIEQKLKHGKLINSEISNSSVAWHLDHILKVINGICSTLAASNPSEYKGNITLTARLVLVFKFIPRGKGKSPSSALPPSIIDSTNIIAQLSEAKKNIKTAAVLNPHAHFSHPFFGILNKKRSLRFMETHTKHHLKIVDDILKKGKKA
jgi:hypothetical protein